MLSTEGHAAHIKTNVTWSRGIIHQGVVLFRSSVESPMHRCTHQCDASVKSTDEQNNAGIKQHLGELYNVTFVLI